MSFQAMTWAISQECGSPGEKLVLLMLANYCNAHSGRCNPSHKTLADECSMGVSTLKRHIAALSDRGHLSIRNASQDGVSLPNQYDLNLGGVGPNRAGGSVQSGLGVGPNRATNQESNQEVKPEKKTTSSGSRLPADWFLPKEWFDWAVKERPELDINAQGEQFRDYWHAQAGAKGRKADWQATWRNWIRNARAPRANGFHTPVNNGAQPAVLGDFHDHPDFLL